MSCLLASGCSFLASLRNALLISAALALLVQRLLGRRLQEAGVDLSPARAMPALSTVRLVTFRRAGQPERRGMAGGCPDARLVLKALKQQFPALGFPSEKPLFLIFDFAKPWRIMLP